MNNTAKGVFIFVAGAAIGVASTLQFFRNKYAKIAQEEIDSVKEAFSRLKSNPERQTEASTTDEEEADEYSKYDDVIRKYHTESDELADDEEFSDKPCVIPPVEFGRNDEYERISLTYYADKVLVDEDGDPVVDIEGTIGSDSLNHFGDYEPDSVYVRNDVRKAYYEILSDLDNYSDVIKKGPRC